MLACPSGTTGSPVTRRIDSSRQGSDGGGVARLDLSESDVARGRGAVSNPAGRFEAFQSVAFDDGWGSSEERETFAQTSVTPERAKSIITYNESPDIGFDRSINPYRGCEHGCVYCFARPSHSYLGLSAGLDFETKIFAKTNAVELLETELRKKTYEVNTIVLGVNTDCYQPAERKLQLTRGLLEVLLACGHPVGTITKSALILRDLDLWSELAARKLAHVNVSVTTLNRELARKLEPRAPTPEKRLEAIAGLTQAGVRVGVMAAPLIPGLNDHEMEAILARAQEAGAERGGYVLLRLPHEVKGIFADWLQVHAPGRAEHVMALVRETRDGKEYQAEFGTRMRGTGNYAEMMQKRFDVAVRRLGLNQAHESLDRTQFRPPQKKKGQMQLF